MRSKEDVVPNLTLASLRKGQALSQQEVADRLNEMAREETGHPDSITATTVSRWERGIIDRPESARRRRLLRLSGVEVAYLGWDGVKPCRKWGRSLPTSRAGSERDLAADGESHLTDERVVASQPHLRASRVQASGLPRLL